MAYMYKENRLVLAFTAVSPFAHQHMQIHSCNKEIRYGLSTQDAKNSGSLGFCTFKASRRQPDVAQPQFTTATHFSSCVVRVYSKVA